MPRAGLVHAHSTFSSDGVQDLEHLAADARRLGFDFLVMTDHAEEFDADTARRFVRECARVSDERFLAIPGFEFSCAGGLHLLGLGIVHPTDARDPLAVARAIGEQGGLAIVAHPSRSGYRLPEGLVYSVHGIEIWNARYDGWFVPNDEAIGLLAQLRKTHEALIAIGGQDLHAMTDRGHVKTVIDQEELTARAILQALAREQFSISNSYIRLHPRALHGTLRGVALACARRVFLSARWMTRPVRDRFRRRRVRPAVPPP
jgi:hypothetical protein